MAKDSKGNDHELLKRLQTDDYMQCAVKECYLSCKIIIRKLVKGDPEVK